MKRSIPILASAVALAAAAPAAASPQQDITLERPTATWTTPVDSGLNTSYFVDSVTKSGTCANTDVFSRCDRTLVKLAIPTGTPLTGATLKVRMHGLGPADDFDLRVYDMGFTGKTETYLGSPTSETSETSPAGGLDPRNTFLGDAEYKLVTGLKPGRFYRVDIVYFTVANSSTQVTVTADKLPAPPATTEATGTTAKRVKAKRAAKKRAAR